VSYLIEKYIRDNVKNPELSDVRSALNNPATGIIDINFENQNVAMIIATNFLVEGTVAPGAVTFTDATTNRIIVSSDIVGFPGGGRTLGLFFYIWNCNRLNITANSLNFRFTVQYQLVYGNREKTTSAE
jgi:hypothetical protein